MSYHCQEKLPYHLAIKAVPKHKISSSKLKRRFILLTSCVRCFFNWYGLFRTAFRGWKQLQLLSVLAKKKKVVCFVLQFFSSLFLPKIFAKIKGQAGLLGQIFVQQDPFTYMLQKFFLHVHQGKLCRWKKVFSCEWIWRVTSVNITWDNVLSLLETVFWI